MAKKLLIVGAIPDEKNKLRYGGATVLMKNFLDYLDSRKIKYGFVQTNKFSNLKTGEKRPLLNKIHFLVDFLKKFIFYDTIMFNFSDNGVTSVFPLLLRISKLNGKKVVLRKFGGSFELFLKKCSDTTRQKTFTSLKRCDLILFETKASIQHLKKHLPATANIEWFPNNRTFSACRKDPKDFSKNIVFISQICDEKGVGDILQATEQITPEYQIHIYGYIAEDKYRNYNWSSYNIFYHGEIPSSRVPEVLSQAGILLLPSYREGYPGIIIEAFSIGIPVIASNIGGIPEMMADEEEGRLITPGNVDALVSAIRSIDKENYAAYSQKAYERFSKNFDSTIVNERIYKKISEL